MPHAHSIYVQEAAVQPQHLKQPLLLMFVWPLLTDICGKGSIYSLKSSTRKDGPCTSFPISKITVHEESHTNLHRVSFNKTSHKSSLVITKIININSRVVDTSSGCIVTSIILQGKETPYTYWQIHLLIFSTQLILHLP